MEKKAETSGDSSPQEDRCLCGQLMAVLTLAGVELKCRRCKRIHVIPWRSTAVRL